MPLTIADEGVDEHLRDELDDRDQDRHQEVDDRLQAR